MWLRAAFRKRQLKRRLAALEGEMKGHGFEIVGMVTISWAFLELGLDLTNDLVMSQAGGDTIHAELPASLNRKIAFMRKAFRTLPPLQPFTDEAIAIADEVSSLKEKRHDMVHGYTHEYLPMAAREIARLRYVGKTFAVERRIYTLQESMQLNLDIMKLARRAVDLTFAVGRSLAPNDPLYNKRG